MAVTDIHIYAENTRCLLHNQGRSVCVSSFSSMERGDWKSLQLIRVQNARFFQDDYMGKKKRKCSFRYNDISYTFPVTCPNFDKYLNSTLPCYLTISMSGPIAFDEDTESSCWKMVAGIIE